MKDNGNNQPLQLKGTICKQQHSLAGSHSEKWKTSKTVSQLYLAECLFAAPMDMSEKRSLWLIGCRWRTSPKMERIPHQGRVARAEKRRRKNHRGEVAMRAPKGYPRFGSLILGGLLGILAGLLAFIMPGITALGLLILIAAWAMLTGILEIAAAIKLRKVVANEWLLVLAGIASVAFGVLLILQPAAGALLLVWWVGAYAIVLGILLFVLALRIRRLGQRPFAPA
jgi:Short repeat of unknown function (DUF308)